MAPNENIKVFGTIVDRTGNDRLVLRFVQSDLQANGYNLYSLDWEVRDGATWAQKVAISRAEFEKGCPQRRWVSRLQSFDPGSARAILQIGEEGVRDGCIMRVTYTWREWDLVNNQEVRVIRVCKSPFE